MSFKFEAYIEKYQELKSQQKDFITVTLVKVVGSAPQDLGARMIVTREGLFWGTVGGGKIENHMIEKAKLVLSDSKFRLQELEVNLQKDIGMSCGGAVGFLLEAERAIHAWNVALFGAGHVVQEVVRLLLPLEVKVSCFDSRPEWIAKLPEAKNLKRMVVDNLADQVASLSENTFVLSITMGHNTDLPILHQALRRSFPFVGAIGSELKAKKLSSELVAFGFELNDVARLVCPLGLSLGTNAPYEIAISIVAQLIQERDRLFSN